MTSSSFDQDKELAEFFTDVEHLREAFKEAVAAPTLAKRLFVIHGVGGVGKSSLLRMFRLHCKSVNVPVALASGDEAKSALDVLVRWADDLKADGVVCPSFSKTYKHYRALQAKVETEAGKIAGQAVKGAAKTVIETAASTIPGVGPLLGKLGGSSVEALADILLSRGFKRPDIDLLLDPTKKLTNDFLGDITKAADKRRFVLMLDTYEQVTALEDWTREVAQCLHPNVLFVIAGRALPNWGRTWDSWMATAQVEELTPMTEDVMRDLVRRYYATIRGGLPNAAQVEAIIRFARGLPMVVTSAVQLWVKYGVEDFQSVKAEIVANLVDRLMEGVPSALIPALEAAAIVRWFDQPILRAVMKQDDVREVYNELRRFPFVRTRVEGLALHDVVRDIMDENLRAHDSERHGTLHDRAVAYFETRLETTISEEADRLGLERLYHRVCVDEETGIKLFQEMAEELTRYRLVSRLRTLLNDVNLYRLELENSMLWREYYHARVAQIESRWAAAETTFATIIISRGTEPKLEAYTSCSFGFILSRWRRLGRIGQTDKVIKLLETSLNLVPIDPHLVTSFSSLAHVYDYLHDWNKATVCLERVIQYHKEQNDVYGLMDAYNHKKSYLAQRGDWQEMFAVHKLSEEILPWLMDHSYFRARFFGWSSWAWAYAGRCLEGTRNVEKGLTIANEIDDVESIGDFGRDLAFLLICQCRYFDAVRHLENSLELYRSLGQDHQPKYAMVLSDQGLLFIALGKLEEAEKSLISSLRILQEFKMEPDTPEVLVRLGYIDELRKHWNDATKWYSSVLKVKNTGRWHELSEAFIALVRVKHAQGDYAAIPPLFAEAEQLAQQYEYNDHLASLRLTQGHIAWEGNAPTWDNGFEAALCFYQHALIYALRYNRFLLDEVLSGRPQGTPLRPIIPHFLERGEEGRQMLTALRDWWKTGVNDIGTPRPDTISPIPECIPLLEAEHLAREREPGDGSPQKSAIEQIEAALI